MEAVIFSTATDLKKYFSIFGTSVAPRNGPKRGTHDEKELFNLRQYLLTLADNNFLEFPLKVEKSESPDFILTKGKTIWGLEVTEATTEDWQRELAETKNDTSAQLIRSEGWTGDSPERETCAAILCAMRRKVKKIKKGGYQQVSRYDLLIYVNVRAIFYDFHIVDDMLVNCISRHRKQWVGLGRVNVILARHLLVDVTNDRKILQLFGKIGEQT